MDWIVKATGEIFAGLSQLFTTPLFEIGNTRLSLGSIVQLILLAIAVFIASRATSEWIKLALRKADAETNSRNWLG